MSPSSSTGPYGFARWSPGKIAGVVRVEAPLHHVAAHVRDAEHRTIAREHATRHRGRYRSLQIGRSDPTPVAIDSRPTIGTPRATVARGAARRPFPLSFRRQSIRVAMSCGDPDREGPGVQPGDASGGVCLSRRVSKSGRFTGFAAISRFLQELQILTNRHLEPSDRERVDIRHARRPLVRRSIIPPPPQRARRYRDEFNLRPPFASAPIRRQLPRSGSELQQLGQPFRWLVLLGNKLPRLRDHCGLHVASPPMKKLREFLRNRL